MLDYIDLPSGPIKHLAYSILGPRLMVFPKVLRQLPIDISLFNTWLSAIANFPQELTIFLERHPSSRLGHYHESLWQFYIQSNPQFDLLAHNLQVFEGKQTTGEFDFILKDRSRKIVYHLEVATKYYLEHVYQGKSYWLGANLRDRFDLKAKRFIDHQIALGDTEPGKMVLDDLGIQKYHKVISAGGMLFNRSEDSAENNFLAPEHLRSRHQTLEEFCYTSDDELWIIIDKPDWLAPLLLNTKDCMPLSKSSLCKQLTESFARDPVPIMVASLRPVKRQHYMLREHQRLFITPNDWAKRADETLAKALDQ